MTSHGDAHSSQTSSAWTLRGEALILRGFAYGSCYPSLVFRIGGPPIAAQTREAVVQILAANLAGFAASARSPAPLASESGQGQPDREWHASVQWLLSLFDGFQQAWGLPVYEPARTLLVDSPEAQFQIACCNRSLSPLGALVGLVLSLIDEVASGRSTQHSLKLIEQQFKALGASGFQGGNVPRFVKAAHEMGMPFKEMPGQFFRFGEGRKGAWLDSSYTQNTGNIAARVARDKAICSQILQMAGLPVPMNRLVANADMAVKAADMIGYPVVVKPADSDGGSGVSAHLQNRGEVARAYRVAASVSSRVMVEKHVAGRDYRLTVHRGELIWAVERVPAGVTGDATQSIAQLVEQENRNPARDNSIHSPLKPIVIDAEALAYLASQGLAADTVPAEGAFVPLRRAANVSSGGMPVAVFDQVHPDNAQLAVAAAKAIKLDLAGIDLLIPDIARSWRETGAGICEVNGQPQIGGTTSAHIYPLILRRELGSLGRIPTVLLLSNSSENAEVQAVRAGIADRGLTVGWHDATGVHIGAHHLVVGEVPLLSAGEMLAGNTDVDVMVLTMSDAKELASGLPTSRIDLVIDCGCAIAADGPMERVEQQTFMAQISRLLLPACDGAILARSSLAKAFENCAVAHTAKVRIQASDEPLPTAWLIEHIVALVERMHLIEG